MQIKRFDLFKRRSKAQAGDPRTKRGGENMQKGNTLVIVLVLVVLLAIGGVVAYMMTQSQNLASQTANTTDMEGIEQTTTGAQTEATNQADADSADDTNAVTINVSARNFAFDPTEIRVKRGDTVKIVLNVEAGMHDWVVDEFNARTAVVNTGETTEVTFVADQAGEFEFYCSVGNHRQMGMVGTLVVEE